MKEAGITGRGEWLVVESLFTGERLHSGGPSAVRIADGVVCEVINGVKEGSPDPGSAPVRRARFAMPPLFEAHAHLFLNGEELDAGKRSAYLKGPREAMLATAFKNVERYRASGVSGVRDAGDIHGVNLELREALRNSGFTVVAAAAGIRKRKRYGSFMAGEVDGESDLPGAIKRIAGQGAAAIKIVLTGIIDFENGVVKDQPQFSLDETRLAVTVAHDLGLKTFVHCSGRAGLEIAVEAGVDSIEHGFFMDRSVLERMAGRAIAWCPTFMPVHFQAVNPHYCGWSETSVRHLQAILEHHRECLLQAHALGVALLAGSDAGSYGVRHGAGLREELVLLKGAGLPAEAVLRAATSAPRNHLGLPSPEIKPGAKASILLLDESPLENATAAARPAESGLASPSPSSQR